MMSSEQVNDVPRCPINELPAELLSHIFLLGFNSDYDEGDRKHTGLLFELWVSHVCRLWRGVSLKITFLWTNIAFGLPAASSHLAKIYLERSKSAPINILIDLTTRQRDPASVLPFPDAKERMHIITIALSHIRHCRSFRLMLAGLDLHSALLALSKCSAVPMLEVLELYCYKSLSDSARAERKEQEFSLFEDNAPQLTRVVLSGVHLNWHRSRFLCGLRELELCNHSSSSRPSFREFVRILRDCPELTSLTLHLSGPAGGADEWLASIADAATSVPSTALSLPSLASLVLQFHKSWYVTQLLQWLVLPRLASFELDILQDDCTELLRTLLRPQPTTGKSVLAGLQSFMVRSMNCGSVNVMEDVYGELTDLTLLHMEFDFVSEACLVPLLSVPMHTEESTRPVLLPRLHTLAALDLDTESLHDVLNVRKAQGLPIKRLIVDEITALHDMDWLRANVEEVKVNGWLD